MIGIVDYGMGNLMSVFHALEMVGSEVQICRDPSELSEMERLILPGVGAFGHCIANLKETRFDLALRQAIIDEKKPVLGICLGMQAMAQKSYELGEYEGLSFFDSEVIKLSPSDKSLRVPHVGWNEVEWAFEHPLTQGIPTGTHFYFVHSFWMQCQNQADVVGACQYGGRVTAMVAKGNIAATQFHPEKSQDYGLKFLENFVKWKP